MSAILRRILPGIFCVALSSGAMHAQTAPITPYPTTANYVDYDALDGLSTHTTKPIPDPINNPAPDKTLIYVDATAPVPRPNTTPCIVTVPTAGSAPTYTYTPDPKCPGPWAKVVLTADFSYPTNRAPDRGWDGDNTLIIGDTPLLKGTTPEPDSGYPTRWHIERDVTDFLPILTSTTPLPVSSSYNEVAKLAFYPASTAYPAPATPSHVFSFHRTGYDDIYVGWDHTKVGIAFNEKKTPVPAKGEYFHKTTDTLPRNITRAYLDMLVYTHGSPDDSNPGNYLEFWYYHTPYLEYQVFIDGTLAGIIPAYPRINTGMNTSDAWNILPAGQTLNNWSYRADLTPFAGVLNDGKPHTLEVGSNIDEFADDPSKVGELDPFASLLLYTDQSATTPIKGAVTQNDLATAKLTVDTKALTAQRSYTISGYLESSDGSIRTTNTVSVSGAFKDPNGNPSGLITQISTQTRTDNPGVYDVKCQTSNYRVEGSPSGWTDNNTQRYIVTYLHTAAAKADSTPTSCDSPNDTITVSEKVTNSSTDGNKSIYIRNEDSGDGKKRCQHLSVETNSVPYFTGWKDDRFGLKAYTLDSTCIDPESPSITDPLLPIASTTLKIVIPFRLPFSGPMRVNATLSPSDTAAGSATGTVQFYNFGVPYGPPVTINKNVATLLISDLLGVYSFTAVYSGDGNYLTSTAPLVLSGKVL